MRVKVDVGTLDLKIPASFALTIAFSHSKIMTLTVPIKKLYFFLRELGGVFYSEIDCTHQSGSLFKRVRASM